MFSSTFYHSLDGKGRMIVPAKFREGLGQLFVITQGFDKCIYIYTLEEWNITIKKYASLPIGDPVVRKIQRFMIGGATECEPDAQGRIIIPPHLRRYAEIKKEIVSTGLTSRIEIWAKENWDDFSGAMAIDDEMAQRISELNI